MKVPYRQKLQGLFFQPPSFAQGLALGAVAIAAGVIARALKTARVASLQMPAEFLSPTNRNGPHHFLLTGRYAMRSLVALPVLTKHIGQLGACFSCRQLVTGRQHAATRLQRAVGQIEQVQGTPSRAEFGLADLQIALGAL